MRTPLRTLAFVSAAAALAACAAPDEITRSAADAEPRRVVSPVCVDFEPPLFGAWGPLAGGGTPPGTVIFVSNGVSVTIHRFWNGGAWTYGGAAIGGQPVFGVGSGATMHMNHANVGFDFTGLAFPVRFVTFDWHDLGGDENLVVNGSPLYFGEFELAPALGGEPLSSVVNFSWAPNQEVAQMTIGPSPAGVPVSRVVIGGQELWIDNVCAYP